MTNKEIIEIKANKDGLVIGCWDDKMESLNKKELQKVLDSMEYDVDVKIGRKLHVVEIDVVDNEIDFSVLTKGEYINRYGDERWED